MPVCDRCRIAYMDGESHRCEKPTNAGLVALMAVCGFIVGAIAGFFVLTVAIGVLTQSNLSGVAGIFVGAPIGGLLGARAGVRNADYGLLGPKPRSTNAADEDS